MRSLNCPQCDVNRFFVKNEKGESLLVNVTSDSQIIPVHPEESMVGFDLTLLYCLGCSWSGSPKALKNHLRKHTH
jgi:hypothetical protein